jgi:hypothetical protein
VTIQNTSPETDVARTVYCTVVAENYLPQALALYASIRDIEPERELVLLVIDKDRTDLEKGREHLRVATTADIGLTRREVLDLAAIYDVVEFATAVKPAFFKKLLEEFERVVYLDPDMYVVAPLVDLDPLIDEFGVVLTPHFLDVVPAGMTHITEVHSLTVGVHNLGFCAVGRNGLPFLDWWWSHLSRECLIYPLLGIFVDQKWTDIGATLFRAHTLRHYGYNVGPHNLHERFFENHEGEWLISKSREPLRLMHFSGFNPQDPEAISVRLSEDLRAAGVTTPGLSQLSRIYAERVNEAKAKLGPRPSYGFTRDSSGKVLSKRTRRAYRKALLALPEGVVLPSPFLMQDRDNFRAWHRRALISRAGVTLGDAALAIKYVFPDEFTKVKSALPKQFSWVRSRLLAASRVRR